MNPLFNKPNATNNVPAMSRKTIAQDNVNQPAHYKGNGVECIEAIKSALSEEEFKGYLKGNSLKYNWRAGKKSDNGVEDIKKAIWYQNKLIEVLDVSKR